MGEYIVTRMGVDIDLGREGHTGCPRCLSKGNDRNNDNLMVYGLDEDGDHRGAHCFSCEYKILSKKRKDELGGEEEWEDVVGSEFNPQVHKKLVSITGTDPKGYRNITKAASEFFGVRYGYSTQDASIVETYYPDTIDWSISGFKKRIHPKDFTQPVGTTGSDCDLFGLVRYKESNGTLVICGGEHDVLAAKVMFDSSLPSKYTQPAIASSTVGETAAYKQIQKNYHKINKFNKIIVCMDNDRAGKEAFEKILKVLPRNKVYLMKMDMKDPQDYLDAKKDKEFIQAYWGAKLHTPAGVYASSELYDAALDCLDAKVISLPPFMKVAAGMLGGGLIQEEITMILAKTSIGKTLLVNEITKNIIMSHPEHTVGVLSLEATYKKYSRNLLSSFLKIPLHRKSAEEKKEILSSNEQRIKEFYVRGDGTPKFFVCDDRGASIEGIKEKVMEMIIHFGITILIFDPYSDLLSGLSVSEQEELATWVKRIMKEYAITPIVVSHVRKGSNNTDERLTEDDAQGSSFLAKGAGITIALERNKQHEDPIERNRTHCYILKNREFSETGAAGSFYYDIQTATLNDFDEYWSGKQ